MISVAKSRRARGTALLLAIAMTLLLFIMGFAFLITTQNQTEIAVDTGLRISVDAGVDAVVEQINTVLTEDLFDENGNFLAGNGIVPGPVDTGEPWDYPSHFVLPGPDLVFGSNDDVTTLAAYQNDADPWLASIEPFVVDYRETPMDPSDDDVGFLHISDIYGTLARLFISGYDSSSGSLFFDDEGNTPGSVDRVSFRNLRATIIDPTAPIPSNPAFNTLGLSYAPGEGAKADADGDGVADSRWVKIPNLTGPGGEDFYAAVRIIDNCAMVNVNTALTFRNDAQTVPLTSQGSRQLGDGSRLTDINLIGLKRSTDDPTALNTYRSSITELDYHYDVARRLLNPVALPRSTLFGFDDEMEFRHRFFINNAFSGSGGGLRNILTPLETRWPLTFDNGSGQYSKWQPYDNSADLSEWYAKAFAHPAILTDTATDHYTRRHLITTYSFDRIVAPWPADRTTPVSFSTAPTINNDPMPTDFYNAWIEWTNWDNSDSSKWTFRPVPVNDIVANTHPAITALTDPIATLAAAIWLALPNNTRLTAGSAVFSSLAPFSEVGWSTTEIRDRLAGMFAANMVDYIDNVNDLPSTTVDDPTELIIGSDVFYGFEANGERLRFGLVGMSKTRPAPGDPPNEHFVVQIFNAGVVDAHFDLPPDQPYPKWNNTTYDKPYFHE